MFTIPIRWRLTLFHAVTTLAVALVLIAALFALVARTIDRDAEDSARARAFEAAAIVESGRSLTSDDLRRLGTLGAYVIARDGNGNVVAQTDNVGFDRDQSAPFLWQEALQTREVVERAQSLSWFANGPTSYQIAVPILRQGAPIKVVEAGRSYGGPGRDYIAFTSAAAVGGIALLGVLVAVGGSFLLARAALSPVHAIVASARQITESDLSKRLPVKRKRDELGRLAQAFNELLARLDVAFRQRDEALTQQRRFIADASHELRTPLTSIQGYARMLRQWALDDPDATRESIAAIERETARMSDLVENLFRLAHGDEATAFERANYDLRAVASTAVDAARAAQDRVKIEYESPSSPVVAAIDRPRIHQVLTILLDNAIKYTPEGGLITVAVRGNANSVDLTVTDTGSGIPADHLPHLFERFYRVESSRTTKGAGLGLAIAKQIAEQHGGTITVDSAPGRGSTFTLRLPIDRVEDSPVTPLKRKRRLWKRMLRR